MRESSVVPGRRVRVHGARSLEFRATANCCARALPALRRRRWRPRRRRCAQSPSQYAGLNEFASARPCGGHTKMQWRWRESRIKVARERTEIAWTFLEDCIEVAQRSQVEGFTRSGVRTPPK
eukprot:1140723-Pleurochrysis_carterae.AAC.1